MAIVMIVYPAMRMAIMFVKTVAINGQ